jgi:structural maintenance of chromosome 4
MINFSTLLFLLFSFLKSIDLVNILSPPANFLQGFKLFSCSEYYTFVMQIRFLELENFKSYSGLHRIGPFENKVSCIIGPNGCGKSNVLDSLLFIFGFKSEKLRQDNLKSLIHRSSKVFATSCRVSVILETKEGQIKITRAIS